MKDETSVLIRDLPFPFLQLFNAHEHYDDMLFQSSGDERCYALVNHDLRISMSLGAIWCSRKREPGSAFCWYHDVWNVLLGGDLDEWLAERGLSLIVEEEPA